MREIGEQWIEEIDGKRHMVKAVKGVEGEKLCTACIFKPRIYPDYSKIRHDTVQTPFRCAYGVLCPIEEGYIIDLGILNEDGCLPSDFGVYPEVYEHVLMGINGYMVKAYISDPHVGKYAWGKTKEQAIDAWNRRA